MVAVDANIFTYHCIAENFTSGSLCPVSCCLSQCQIHQKSNVNKMTKSRSRSNVLEMQFEQIPSQCSECSSLNSEPLLGDVSEVSTVKGAITEIIWSAVFDLINLLGEIPVQIYLHLFSLCYFDNSLRIPN